MVSEKLTEARFQTLVDDYEQEQAELTEKINHQREATHPPGEKLPDTRSTRTHRCE